MKKQAKGKDQGTGKPRQRERRTAGPAKRAGGGSGTVPDLSAGAEDLTVYAGNSAMADDAREAREAYARAEAWARGEDVYGFKHEVKR